MGATNGRSDSQFVGDVRRILRDQPVIYAESQPTDGTTGSLAAGSKPYRLQRAPVWKGTGNVLNLTAPGGPYTVDLDNYTPLAGHVGVITDTGEVIFNTAPAAAGQLNVTYQTVRFSETQVTAALYEGLQLLWPEIWNPNIDTVSIAISPTQFEYPLPTLFQDQRVILLSVEYAPPSGIVRYFKTSLWRTTRDIVNPLLIFSRLPPVASVVRLTYTAPIGNTNPNGLGLTPSIAMHLPTYYAMARLLLDQDTMRTRSDDLPALTGEAAQQPGVAVQTANYWMQQFSTQLTRLALEEPVRRLVQHRAVERLGLSAIWNDSE